MEPESPVLPADNGGTPDPDAVAHTLPERYVSAVLDTRLVIEHPLRPQYLDAESRREPRPR